MTGQKGPLGLEIHTEKKAIQAANRILLKRQQGKYQVLNCNCVINHFKTDSIIPVHSPTFSLMVAIFFNIYAVIPHSVGRHFNYLTLPHP